MKVMVLNGSPRQDGNSATLAKAAAEGVLESGHQVVEVFADDILKGFLRDCRQCRNAQGECTIGDKFAATFIEHYLPAEGFIAATPIYWYGMSAQLKAFFDRMFCVLADSANPRSSESVAQMQGKRIGLLLSSEETFPTASAGIVHQVQEYARYNTSTLVGVVHGVGNSRGEVALDPLNPVEQARQLGRELFSRRATDYQIDTPRSERIWG